LEPDAKLDALGEELEGLVAGLSQGPQQFFQDPGKLARLKSLLQEIQSTGKQELGRIVAESQAHAESAKAMKAEIESAKRKKASGEKGAGASQPQEKPWPPDSGGLALSFWLEKEFTPPTEQMEALTAQLLSLVRRPGSSPPRDPRPRR
jgi:hypothetical protein